MLTNVSSPLFEPAVLLLNASKVSPLPDFDLSTYAVTAAYPRSTSNSNSLRKQANLSRFNSTDAPPFVDRLVNLKHHTELQQPTAQTSNVLCNVVDHFVNRNINREVGVSLLLLHANGCPRQTFTPAIKHLLAYDSLIHVNDIWSFEAVHQGDSAVFNKSKLDDTYFWADHTRDILNFLRHHVPVLTLGDSPSSKRDARVIAIAHSFSGSSLTMAALEDSRLFKALILIEPTIVPPSPMFSWMTACRPLMIAAIKRRSCWPSKSEAQKELRRSPFYRQWDSSALDNYITHAICSPSTDSPVCLKTTGFDEAIGYTGWTQSQSTWERLPLLHPRVSLHWILSSQPTAFTGGIDHTDDLTNRRSQNSHVTKIAHAGHMLVQEVPQLIAQELLNSLELISQANTEPMARL